MADAVFKPAVRASTEPIKLPQAKPLEGVKSNEVSAAPIVDAPLTAAHYGVEKFWNDPDTGLQKDIETIENYFRDGIMKGESEQMKKDFLAKCEMECGVDFNERPSVKLAQVANYIKYLSEQARISRDKARYTI